MSAQSVSQVHFGLISGLLTAIFAVPLFYSGGGYTWLGGGVWWLGTVTLAWIALVPLCYAFGLWFLARLPLPYGFTHEFARYGIIGVLNTLLSLSIFNLFMALTGITSGPWVTVFSTTTFALVITHAFLWNKFLVFRSQEIDPQKARREYVSFFAVSGSVALLNVGLISLMVDFIAPPWGLSAHAWANVAMLLTIPVSVLGNFFGYKLFVFKKP